MAWAVLWITGMQAEPENARSGCRRRLTMLSTTIEPRVRTFVALGDRWFTKLQFRNDTKRRKATSKRVLIAQSDLGILRHLHQLFDAAGWRIATARGRTELLDHIASILMGRRVDAVISQAELSSWSVAPALSVLDNSGWNGPVLITERERTTFPGATHLGSAVLGNPLSCEWADVTAALDQGSRRAA